MLTTAPHANRRLWAPQRHLAADVAQALHQAHLRTGWSYRHNALRIGISHSHLLRLCQGVRVPSRGVAARLAQVLPLSEEEQERLMEVAAVPWRKRVDG
jgi:ribosome-binding protein aMBF1 (putative translation factor)